MQNFGEEVFGAIGLWVSEERFFIGVFDNLSFILQRLFNQLVVVRGPVCRDWQACQKPMILRRLCVRRKLRNQPSREAATILTIVVDMVLGEGHQVVCFQLCV